MGPNLREAAAMWPTADANAINDGETLEAWEARRQRNLVKHNNGHGMGTPLAISAQQFPPLPWGTPRATDTKGADNNGHKLPRDYLDAQADKDFPPSPQPATITPNGCVYSKLIRLLCQLFGVQTEAEFRAVLKQLNPRFVELLMGWPLGWSRASEATDSDCAATEWSGNRRQPQPCACGAD
jgi:hypothetical protein